MHREGFTNVLCDLYINDSSHKYVHFNAHINGYRYVRDALKWKFLSETETEYTETIGRKPKPNTECGFCCFSFISFISFIHFNRCARLFFIAMFCHLVVNKLTCSSFDEAHPAHFTLVAFFSNIIKNRNVLYFFFGLFTPSAETENYVLGHFRPNIFGGRIFGASLVIMPCVYLLVCLFIRVYSQSV